MSRDEQGERIIRKVGGQPTFEDTMPCGGVILGINKARFRRCSRGHTHCMACLREARRFGKGWTCGICTHGRDKATHVDIVSISSGETLLYRTQPDDPEVGSQVKEGWATYVYMSEPHTMTDCFFKGAGLYADRV